MAIVLLLSQLINGKISHRAALRHTADFCPASSGQEIFWWERPDILHCAGYPASVEERFRVLRLFGRRVLQGLTRIEGELELNVDGGRYGLMMDGSRSPNTENGSNRTVGAFFSREDEGLILLL